MEILVFLFASLMITLLVGQIYLSYWEGTLDLDQMRAHGVKKGMPLMRHMGILSDGPLVTPLMIVIVFYYVNQWTFNQTLVSMIIGCVFSILMHILYCRTCMEPECVTSNRRLALMGMAHCIYMANVLTTIILFYFCTQHVGHDFLIVATLLLSFHVVLGNHIITSFYDPEWWTPRPHKDPKTWAQIVLCWCILWWRVVAIW